jgi:chromate transporter
MTVVPSLTTVLRSWGRIGCLGFGGPPAHIRLLRELCVERERWIGADEFEDAIATCNLLPGPSSTQLAIFTAWRVRGTAGAVIGGLAFIVPGLIAILALAALFLGRPPAWVLGAGAGAGAAVAAVAVHAGWGLTPASWSRRGSTARWVGYVVAGAAAAAVLGAWVVVVLLVCGLAELTLRRPPRDLSALAPLVAVGGGTISAGVLLSLAWTSFKVGALSYGGGFVIIPLMQADAVAEHRWMSGPEFLNAVALGQITPVRSCTPSPWSAMPPPACSAACWRRPWRSARRSPSCCWAAATSTGSGSSAGSKGSSPAPARPRSEPSTARRCRWRASSSTRGSTSSWPAPRSPCSPCAAVW